MDSSRNVAGVEHMTIKSLDDPKCFFFFFLMFCYFGCFTFWFLNYYMSVFIPLLPLFIQHVKICVFDADHLQLLEFESD